MSSSLESALNITMGSLGGRNVAADPLARLDAVHAGHHDVEDDEVGRALLDLGESVLTVLRGGDLVALDTEIHRNDVEQSRIVVNDKDSTPSHA